MSILDDLDPRAFEERAIAAAKAFGVVADSPNVSPKMRSILDHLKDGLSLADIIGLKKEHRDAFLVQAGTMIQAGDLDGAKDMLTQLVTLEPLDERPVYLLGFIAQQKGAFDVAAKLYAYFLGYDATNPDGYLRLGECLLGAGELDNAEGTFQSALHFGQKQNRADCIAHANKMLDVVKMRRNRA